MAELLVPVAARASARRPGVTVRRWARGGARIDRELGVAHGRRQSRRPRTRAVERSMGRGGRRIGFVYPRSEEHTSELQSQSNLVCRLLLEIIMRGIDGCWPFSRAGGSA